MTPDGINELIDDCIDHLCDDNPEYGAGSLAELARIWAKSGLGMQSFLNTRKFIIDSSIERLGTSATPFIHYKLQVAESELRKQRLQTSGTSNGHIIIQ
jgi:hypothetical protein